MPGELQDLAKRALIKALEGAQDHTPEPPQVSSNGGGLSGLKGVAAGAGAAAVLPLAVKGVAKGLGIESPRELFNGTGNGVQGLTSRLGGKVASGLGDKVSEKVDDAGGPAGILKGLLPLGGGSDDDDEQDQQGLPGTGKGRRMPVQQSVDIGADVETVYNQWTQYEMWPTFMHRVTRVTQEDPGTVSFATRIWGKTKEFTAKIETQRPDERVKWRVSEGMTHTGVVTFHEVGPHLTRVLLNLDVEPGGMIEKLARGARYVKRAARGDLHRFKALIEMTEQETGAWRGVIEDGRVVEDHDPKYDKQRDYADLDEIRSGAGGGGSGDDDSEDDSKQNGRGSRRASSRGGSANGRTAASTSRSKSTSSSSGGAKASRGRAGAGSRSGRGGGRAKASSRSGGSSGSGSQSGRSSRSSRSRGGH